MAHLFAHDKEEGYLPIRMSYYSNLEATYPAELEGSITYEILNPPNGTFETDEGTYGNDVVLPNFIYYPSEDPGYGLDQFTFRITDGVEYSNTAIINLRIDTSTPPPTWRIGSRVKTNSSIETINVYSTKQYQNPEFDILQTYNNENVVGTIRDAHFCDIWAQNDQFQYLDVWRCYVLFDDGIEGWVNYDELLVAQTLTPTVMQSSVTHYDITWYFDALYPVGKFVNGEPFVIGPVTVAYIDPDIRDSNSGSRNGSMVNPITDSDQGFDSNADPLPSEQAYVYNYYRSTLNASLSTPNLILNPDDVLVSSKQTDLVFKTRTDGTTYWAVEDTKFKTIAALTVLSESPPISSFRPSIWGTDRTIKWNYNDINWDLLPNLEPPYTTVPYETIIPKFLKALPWFEWSSHSGANDFRPRNNFSDGGFEYGREVASKFGGIGLWLACDWGDIDKQRDVAIKMIQNGLDIYDWFQNGGSALPDGGHNAGKKLPVVIAATLLEDTTMKTWLSANPNAFQEDGQLFRISEADPYIRRYLPENDSWYGRRVDNYTVDMIGLPEWGARHCRGTYTQNLTGWEQDEELKWDNAYWLVAYRDVNFGGMMPAWFAARLLNMEDVWANPVAFDYMERVAKLQGPARGRQEFGDFTVELWEKYHVISPELSATGLIPLQNHSIIYSSSEQFGHPATNVLNESTFDDWWTLSETETTPAAPPPHSIIIELDKHYNLMGVDVRSTTRQNDGYLLDFQMYGSVDNSTWQLLLDSYVGSSDQLLTVLFPTMSAKYFKLVAPCTYTYPGGDWRIGTAQNRPSLNIKLNRLQLRQPVSEVVDPLSGMTVVSPLSIFAVSSEGTVGTSGADHKGIHCIDNNPNTYWGSCWRNPRFIPPHWIMFDLGESKTVSGLRYYPYASYPHYGSFRDYEIYVTNNASTNINQWGSHVAKGDWTFNGDLKIVAFPPTTGRYVILNTTLGDGGPSNGDAIAVQIDILE